MKSVLSFVAAVFAAVSALFPDVASARISDAKNDVEGRLISKTSGAYIYASKEDRFREAMELPYKHLFLMMPRSTQNYFFYKRANDTLSANSDTVQQYDIYGWELHLCLDNDISVLEFYRRHGEPITVEELEKLFEVQTPPKEGVFWKKNNYVDVVREWNLNIKNDAFEYAPKSAKANAKISEILPKSRARFVYVEIPEDVKSATNFQQMLQSQIIEYEQRNAYEAYRQYIARQAAYSSAKTAQTSSSSTSSAKKKTTASSVEAPKRINPVDAYTARQLDTEIYDRDGLSIMRYKLEDVLYGGTPVTTPTKDVRLTFYIPNQPDTAFGYDYETSDGSVRAKLYKSGVVFIDAKFDKSMRDYLETLYKKQADKRADEATLSVSRF